MLVHSQGILVGIVTRIRAGRSTVRIPVGAHQASYSNGTRVLFKEYSSQGVTLATNLPLVLRLRMIGGAPNSSLVATTLYEFRPAQQLCSTLLYQQPLTASLYLHIYHILSDIILPVLTSVYRSVYCWWSPLCYSFHRPLFMHS
jgi:hypothetical protein